MEKREKLITTTTQFPKFKELCKKLRYMSDLLIKLPNGIIVLDHNKNIEDSTPCENFVIWKDELSKPYFNWAVVDPKNFITIMNENNVKIKGTEVSEDEKTFYIFKDGEHVYDIDKLRGEYSERVSKALSHYKKMQQFIWSYNQFEFHEIDPSLVSTMVNGQSISLEVPGYQSVILAKSLFPLLKKEETKMSYCSVDYDAENNKVFLLIKEEYDDYDIYTLIAYIAIDIDRYLRERE